MNEPHPSARPTNRRARLLMIEDVLAAIGVTPQELEAVSRRRSTAPPDLTLGEFVHTHALETQLRATSMWSTYRSGLRAFVKDWGDLELSAITAEHVERTLEHLEEQGKASGHSGSYQWEHGLRSIRWVLAKVLQAGLLDVNVGRFVKFRVRPESTRRPLTTTELETLLRVCHTTGNDPALDFLIVWFLRETACRRRALITLTLGAIDVSIDAVVLHEKNGRRPRIPISTDLRAAIEQHAHDRGADTQDSSARVFRYANGSPLTERRFDSLFQRVQRRIQIGGGAITAHWIRHTTLTDVRVLAGRSVAAAYAGHRPNSGDAIDGYTRVTFQELRAVHDAMFPPQSIRPALQQRAPIHPSQAS